MVREFKRVKNPAGIYVDSTDTRDFAEVVHFVDAVTGQTRAEKLAGKDAAVKPQFENKFASDFVYDKTKGKGAKPGATPAAPEAPAASPFGQK